MAVVLLTDGGIQRYRIAGDLQHFSYAAHRNIQTVCYLFRLNRIPLAKPILQLLESSDVLKIGADVAGDLRSLRQIRHFRDGGFVDLQGIAPEWGIGEKSLRKLSAIVLGQRVSKAQRLSNWEAATLTDKQQLYAATDAWVCIRIYEQLLRTPKKPIRK